jgi:hypothetical protein
MPTRTAAALITILAAAGAARAEPVSLTVRPEPGASMRYEQLQGNRTTFGEQGAELNSRLRFGLAFAEPPEAGAPTPATLTIEALVVDLAQPGMRAYFDSEQAPGDEPSPLAPLLGPAIGSQVTMTIGAGGEVADIETGALAENQAAGMAGLAPTAIGETVNRVVELPQAPDAVEEGDRWTWVRRDVLNPGTTISVAHDMLVESIEDGIVTITFTGGASVSFDEPPVEGEPARPSLEASEISGRIVWDANQGCAVSWNYLSSLDITAVNAEDPTQQALLKVEYTMQLTRLDDD